MIGQILRLLQFELQREWKNRTAVSGLVIFLLASIYTAYLVLLRSKSFPETPLLISLLWLVLIYTCFQNVYNTFMREREGRFFYYYQFHRPEVFIGAKVITTSLFSAFSALLAWLLFRLMLDLQVVYPERLLVALVLGAVGLSTVLTLNGALAAKAGGNVTLMAVLSFPLLLPVLLYSISLSLAADDPLAPFAQDAGILFALDALAGVLVYILYPFLWRE